MKNIELLGIGFCAVDYVGVVPYIPVNSKVEMKNLKKQNGGACATAVFTAARLGLSTGFIGKIGNDEEGKMILEDFKKGKINTSGIIVEENASSATTFVWIEEKTGNRSIAWSLGSKCSLQSEELDKSIIKSAKVIHLDGHENKAAVEAIKLVKNIGTKISLDGGSLTPNIEEIMKYTNFLIVSEEFAKKITGLDKKEYFLKKLKGYKSELVIVTCGKDGYYGYIGEKYIEKRPFKVDVVDTTGAGDVFHGAFLYGYLRGMDFEKALEFASAVASLKCTRFGVRIAIPTFGETVDFIKRYKEQYELF